MAGNKKQYYLKRDTIVVTDLILKIVGELNWKDFPFFPIAKCLLVHVYCVFMEFYVCCLCMTMRL